MNATYLTFHLDPRFEDDPSGQLFMTWLVETSGELLKTVGTGDAFIRTLESSAQVFADRLAKIDLDLSCADDVDVDASDHLILSAFFAPYYLQ